MKLSGLYLAIVLAGSIISSWGKKAEEMKRTTRTSGKRPWTTLALPVRRAIAAPIPPTAIAAAVTRAIARSAPATPLSISAPKISPIARNQRAPNRPSAAVPARRPRTIAKRGIGAEKRRSVKPISMSTARAMPPLLPASISDCIIAPASMNWRKLWTGGKPGSSIAPPAPPVWIASRMVGKTMIGAISCGRRKVWRIERMPSARTTRALVARALMPRPAPARRSPRSPPRGGNRSSRRRRRRASV